MSTNYDRIVGHDCILQVATPATSSMSFITVGGIDADVNEDDELPVVTVIVRGDTHEASYPTGGAKRNLSFTLKPSSSDNSGLAAIKTAKKNQTPLVVKLLDGPAVAGTNYDQYTVIPTKCSKTQPRGDVLTYAVEFKRTKFPGVSDSFDQTYA